MLSLVPYIFTFCLFLTLLSGNLGLVLDNVSKLSKNSIKMNTVKNYWPTVFKSLNLKAIYSSITMFVLATGCFFVVIPMIYYNRYFFSNGNDSKEDYFKDLDSNQIKRMSLYLNNELPKKSTKNNYQLNSKMLLKGVNESDPLNVKLQKVADNMKVHLLLKKPIKVITLNNIGAGKYERMDNLNCIYINSDMENQNLDQKIAILAHEMAHYFLDVHNIRFSETNDNELLTEVCTTYIGFGLILLDGYKYNLNKSKNNFSKVGYVDEKVILESLVLTAELRKQNPNWIIKNVPLDTKVILKYRLRKLIKSYNENKKKSKLAD